MAGTASMSQYLEQKLLAHATATAAYTEPTGIKMLLSTSAYTATSTFTSSPATGEITDSGYSRQTVTFSAATAASPSVANFASNVTFGPWNATAGTAIGYWAIIDGSFNLLFYGTFSPTVTPNAGDSVQIISGSVGGFALSLQ